MCIKSKGEYKIMQVQKCNNHPTFTARKLYVDVQSLSILHSSNISELERILKNILTDGDNNTDMFLRGAYSDGQQPLVFIKACKEIDGQGVLEAEVGVDINLVLEKIEQERRAEQGYLSKTFVGAIFDAAKEAYLRVTRLEEMIKTITSNNRCEMISLK